MFDQIIINNLIHNEDYMRKVVPYLKSEYFRSEGTRIVFGAIDGFVTEYDARPTLDAISILIDKMKLSENVFDQVVDVLGSIEQTVENFDWLIKETESYVRDAAIYNAIQASTAAYAGAGDYAIEEIPELLSDALAISFDSDLGHDYWEMAAHHYDLMHSDNQRHPFKTDILNRITNGGVMDKTLNICAAGINVGKAQPLSTKLLTRQGHIEMRDVKVGDKVLGRDGRETVVTGVFPQGTKDVYEITLWDGRKTRACGEHLWNLYKGSTKKAHETVDTNEIIRLLGTKKYAKGASSKLYLDLPEAIERDEVQLPVDPYVLGCLIGDGSFVQTSTEFTNVDEVVLSKVREEVAKFGCELRAKKHDTITYRIVHPEGLSKGNPFRQALLKAGIQWGVKSHEKTIPDAYMNASIEQRFELLRGLLDTDGTCGKNGATSYSTVSPLLAKQVQELVWSLGGISKIRQRSKSHIKETYKDSYRVSVRMHPNVDLFKVDYKLERSNQRAKAIKGIAIDSIVKVSEEECQCIMVDSPEHLYIADEYVVTHNTTWLIDRAAEWLEQGKNVVYFTFEVAENVIRHRGDVRLMDMPFDRVEAMTKAEYLANVEKLKKSTNGQFKIKEYASGSAHTGHMKAYLRELEQKEGFKPDVILVDYLGEMASSRLPMHMMSNTNIYYGSIARELRALAFEYELPVWTAVQLTRGKQDSTDVTLSDTADAISVPKVADFMVTLVQPDDLALANQARGIVTKNRYANKAKLKNFMIGFDNDRQKTYDLTWDQQEGYMSEQEIEHAKNTKVGNGPERAGSGVGEWEF